MHAETIAAQATAAGPAALAIIRLSGEEAIPLADRLFAPAGRLASLPGRTCAVGFLRDGDEAIDQVVATVFRAPHSYTGEDMVEIACHGGEQAPRRVLDLILRSGRARLARPGEFTLRAFLNGRIDLAQAEAVEALIRARSAAGAAAAVRVLRGDLSRALRRSLSCLTESLARIEAELDVQEDGAPDVLAPGGPGPRSAAETARTLAREEERLRRLLAAGRGAARQEEGLRVVLAGRPNAGKSSLFNALLARERAIVSPHPSTTRDVLEAAVEWDGLSVRLLDTAGVSGSAGPPVAAGLCGARADLDLEGMRRAREEIASAALVVHVVDVAALDPAQAAADGEALAPSGRRLTALHKWDLPVPADWRAIAEEQGPRAPFAAMDAASDARGRAGPPPGGLRRRPAIRPSLDAREGIAAGIPSSVVGEPGTDALRAGIVARLCADGAGIEDAALAGDRQRRLLEEAATGVARARGLLLDGAGGELAAFELRRGMDGLAELLGERVGPRILDEIFARFCVGK